MLKFLYRIILPVCILTVVIGFGAVKAHAVSNAELQAQIAALLAQIAQLQGGGGGSNTTILDGAAQCPDINLRYGDRDATTGGQVSLLQSFLVKKYNLNRGDYVTGYFGRGTQGLVSRFEGDNGLPVTGWVNETTLSRIVRECSAGSARFVYLDSSTYYSSPKGLELTGTAQGEGELLIYVTKNNYGGESSFSDLERHYGKSGVYKAFADVVNGRWSTWVDIEVDRHTSHFVWVFRVSSIHEPLLFKQIEVYPNGVNTPNSGGVTPETQQPSLGYSLVNKASEDGDSFLEGSKIGGFALLIQNNSRITQKITFPTNCWYTYRIYDARNGREVFDLADLQECVRPNQTKPSTFVLTRGQQKQLDFDHPNEVYRLPPGSYKMVVDVNSLFPNREAAEFNFRVVASGDEKGGAMVDIDESELNDGYKIGEYLKVPISYSGLNRRVRLCTTLIQVSTEKQFTFPSNGECTAIRNKEGVVDVQGKIISQPGYVLTPGQYYLKADIYQSDRIDEKDGPSLASDISLPFMIGNTSNTTNNPSISRIEPTTLIPGQEATAYGTNITFNIKAELGGKQLGFVSYNTGKVVFTVPKDLPPGSHQFKITNTMTGVSSVKFVTVAANPTTPTTCTSNTLTAGKSLTLGQTLRSCNGAHTLTLKTDGNLALTSPVVIAPSGVGVIWTSDTAGKGAARLLMQTDGNLVLMTAGGKPLWSLLSYQGGRMGAGQYLELKDNGVLAVYNASGAVRWSTTMPLKSGIATSSDPSTPVIPTPCGGGVSCTPQQPLPNSVAPSCTLINKGLMSPGYAALYWTIKDATVAQLSPGGSIPIPANGVGGQSVALPKIGSIEYILTVSGPGGGRSCTATVSADTTVSPKGSLSLTPCTVGIGKSTQDPSNAAICDQSVSWNTTYASDVKVVVTGDSPYTSASFPNGYTAGTSANGSAKFWVTGGTYKATLYSGTTKVDEKPFTITLPQSVSTVNENLSSQMASIMQALQNILKNLK